MARLPVLLLLLRPERWVLLLSPLVRRPGGELVSTPPTSAVFKFIAFWAAGSLAAP